MDDASPLFRYEPFSDGPDPSRGWYLLADDGDVGTQNITGKPLNTTSHLTSMHGASVSLEFYGTGITLYGGANCSYSVTYDGKLQKQTHTPEGILFSVSKSNDKRGSHNVTLTATPNSPSDVLSFTGAVLTSQVNSTQSIPGTLIQGSQNSMFQYRGTWHNKKGEESRPSDPDSTVQATTSLGDLAYLNFETRAVAVYGPTNASSGTYSVFLNDTLQIFNATTTSSFQDTLLYYRDGLDRFKNCTMQITNLADGKQLAISRVELYNFDTGDVRSVKEMPPPAKHDSLTKPHSGLIAAYVLIAVFSVAIVVLMIWWMKRRHLRFLDRFFGALRSHKLVSCIFRRKEESLTPYRIDEESILSEKRSDSPGSIESNNAPVPPSSLVRNTNRVPSQDQSALERMLRILARSMDPPSPPNETGESVRPPSYRGPI